MEEVAGSSPVESTSLRSPRQRHEDCRVEARVQRAETGRRWITRATTRQASHTVSGFFYVYILESEKMAGRFYTGLTDDLADRVRRHNAGAVPHTAKFAPWRVKTAIAFRDRTRAAAFERYLKTSSGRAFARKRL
ncbi:MAG: GIY-YIG nuclease family protein [Verrucomicrobia bacterium]|nr:GIY-YIG nuclease family protein [Verrucomicrobiota bacterium]